jgi:hypothetical protein
MFAQRGRKAKKRKALTQRAQRKEEKTGERQIETEKAATDKIMDYLIK